MVLNKLIYPIFLECCKYVTDNFWKYIFEDLAYGKTPYGTYIVKNYLCCNYKNKEFSYKIDGNKDSKTLYEEVYNLLHNKFALLSKLDKLKNREIFNSEKKSIDNMKLAFKKKNVKIILIENYTINMKKKHNLSLKQTQKLFSIILIGFIFKTLTIKSIDYSDNKIQNIKGIDFKDSKVIYNIDLYNFSSSPAVIIKDNDLLSDLWVKYLGKIHKKHLSI